MSKRTLGLSAKTKIDFFYILGNILEHWNIEFRYKNPLYFFKTSENLIFYDELGFNISCCVNSLNDGKINSYNDMIIKEYTKQRQNYYWSMGGYISYHFYMKKLVKPRYFTLVSHLYNSVSKYTKKINIRKNIILWVQI